MGIPHDGSVIIMEVGLIYPMKILNDVSFSKNFIYCH